MPGTCREVELKEPGDPWREARSDLTGVNDDEVSEAPTILAGLQQSAAARSDSNPDPIFQLSSAVIRIWTPHWQTEAAALPTATPVTAGLQAQLASSWDLLVQPPHAPGAIVAMLGFSDKELKLLSNALAAEVVVDTIYFRHQQGVRPASLQLPLQVTVQSKLCGSWFSIKLVV